MSIAIKVENLYKAYQIGQIGTGTISHDIERWLAKVRGREDPFLKIGETNDRTAKGASNLVWSLNDLNFTINQGDAVGIIGRNGAGKSTLLKILSRVTSPTKGKVNLKGRVASLLEVGTGFHPELTGRENVFLNGAILGMRKREISKKFDEIVAFAGVERYIDTPVKRYSSGMYVRLAFAVAAHLDSEILIVDEVLAVGDAEFQKKCLTKMREVSQEDGRTILFVSHNMGSIKKLCNKGILLQNGILIKTDKINSVVEKYFDSTFKENIKTEKNGYVNWDENKIGRDECFLCSIAIIQNNNTTNIIDSNREFSIEVKYKVQEQIRDFSIGLNINNTDDEVILHSSDIFAFGNDGLCSKKKGYHKSICIINPNTLNEGSYSLSLSADIPNTKEFFTVTSALKFQVENTSPAASKYQTRMWKGVFNPEVVQWKTSDVCV